LHYRCIDFLYRFRNNRNMLRIVVLASLAAALSGQISTVAGDWEGILQGSTGSLRLGLHITPMPNGGFSSKLDSIDQGALGIAVRTTRVTGNAVHLDLPELRATFDGVLTPDGAEIHGIFNQGVALELNLVRSKNVTPLPRPQLPKPPFPYKSEDVSYQNNTANVRFTGTLTLPPGKGPFPAALLITGSGPQDRDETVAGHKPFLVIADDLAKRGIAVLRVDDRGVGGSEGSSIRASLDDLAGDVLAGVAFLKSRAEIDPKHIGLIGHSEGGIVAPLAASRSKDVAFVVLLAGTGMTGDRVLLAQNELVLRSAGAPTETVEWQISWLRQAIEVLRQEKDEQAAIQKIRAVWEKAKATLPQPIREQAQAGSPDQQIDALASPEFRSLLFVDPAETLRKLKIPVLALAGSRDLQVPPEQNLAAISAALKAGGNKDVEVKELPGLNHLFQKCNLCTVAEYGSIEETFSPVALQELGDWIVRHTRP
jgi:uncharacterized protein